MTAFIQALESAYVLFEPDVHSKVAVHSAYSEWVIPVNGNLIKVASDHEFWEEEIIGERLEAAPKYKATLDFLRVVDLLADQGENVGEVFLGKTPLVAWRSLNLERR